jgi:RNA polymerase sigma-70 factor (ECF subfamily)
VAFLFCARNPFIFFASLVYKLGSLSKIDPDLIEALRKGKRKARSKLYKQLAGPMLSVCLRYTHNRMEAEDVLHDGFIKVYEKIGQYNGKGVFEGWVRRIIVNTAIQHLRNKAKLKESDEVEFGLDQEEISDDLNFPIRPDQLMKLVQSLPDGYRLVFNMYVMEEMNHREIAEALGISEGTSKSQYFNAKKYLRKQIQQLIEQN